MALSKDFMANLTGNRTGGLTTGSSTTGLSLNALIQPVSSSVNTSVKPKTVQPKTLSFTENFKQNAKDVVSGSDDTYGGIIRNTILGIPQAIKDVVKKPKLLLEPAKLIAPGVFERVDAVKESIKQKSFEPLKKSFQEQLKESDIKGLVEITNGEFVRDGKGDIVINKEKADKIINQAIGFIGADLSDVSKQAAKNAAKNFLKQELERRMKYRASRTLEAPVSKAVVPVQPTIKPTGISLSTEQLTKPITQIAKTVQPGVVPTLKSYPYIEEATGQVKTELANVEAGYRTFREGATPQEDRVSIGVSSSFPDWLPDNGRSKKLIDQVLTMMDNGEIPKTSRLKSIYNSIQSAIDLETYKIILRKNPNLTDAEAEQIFQLEDTARQQELTPSQELTAEQEADVSKLQETTPDYATQLTKRNEQNLLQQARENLGIKPPVNPPTVRQLGLSPEPKPVVTTDEKLLKLRLSSEVRGSKEGFRAGVTQTREKLLTQFREKNIEVAEAKKTLVDYIKESLPPANRGMFLSAIKNVGTKAELVKYIDKVDNASNRIELSTAINELKSSIDKILSSPSIDIGYKEELTNFMKDFDLTKMTSKTRERLEQLMKVQESGIKLPVGLQEKMERLSKKSLADMTVDEVRNIADYVAAIQKMGQTKFRTYRNLEEALKETWMEDIKSDAIKTDYVELEQAKIGEPLKIPEKFKNSFRTAANEALALDKALLPMDIVFEMMGPSTKRIVKGTIDSDYQSYLTNFHKDSENIVNKVQELKLDEGNLERTRLSCPQ
jgi:hypothetical protein